jgi:molecular chaperone HscB
MMPARRVQNFFELFGLPVGFDIDTADLARRYRDLQQSVHPDRFASGSPEERRLSMQFTTLINEAFQTLKDPVRRGRYLLSLDGVATNEDSDTSMRPEFLMEQMELREGLEEARQQSDPHTRLAEIANDIERQMRRKIDEFRACYEQGGIGRAGARNAVREMQFLEKLLREIDNLEEELG